MKISEPIEVAGFYRQTDGDWQSACLLTDGIDITEVLASDVSSAPLLQPCTLAGAEAAQGCDLGVSVAELSASFGGPVVSDFRGSDIAMGGRGGPLHPFYLHALSRMTDEAKPLVYLLVEETVCLVWVDPTVKDPTDPTAIVAFETGPAIGKLKATEPSEKPGEVVDGALELFLDDPFFRKLPPKWVEPTSFTHLLELVRELPTEDAQTTLLGMSATSVLLALEHLPKQPAKFVVLGSGAKSELFLNLLSAALDAPIEVPEGIFDPNTINAQAIAYLAARVIRGLPTTAPHTTGVAAAVGGGNVTNSA